MKCRNRVKLWVICGLAGVFGCANATTLSFDSAVGHTGHGLDELATTGTQIPVSEISGLTLTAMFGVDGSNGEIVEYLNSTGSRLGINSDLADEGSSYFDTGEWLGFSFDKDVNVTRFKFTDFTSGDSVKISWGTTVLTLVDGDLTDFNEYMVDWDVGSNETIRFDALGKSGATTTGGFGLEKMDLTVVPEPATFALVGIGGALAFLVRRR